TKANVVLKRIDQLDIADAALELADHAGDVLVALAAKTDGPFHGSSLARNLLPLGTDLGEVIGEDVGCATAVGAVNDDDVLVGELDVGICGRDRFIVPVGDFAEENSGED